MQKTWIRPADRRSRRFDHQFVPPNQIQFTLRDEGVDALGEAGCGERVADELAGTLAGSSSVCAVLK